MRMLFVLAVLSAVGSPPHSRAEEVERTSTDLRYGDETKGRRTVVWTVLPRGYKPSKKYPVVIAITMGGRHQVDRNLSSYWEQEAHSRGYVVVTPEIPGINLYHDGEDLLPALFKWMDANISYDRRRVFIGGAGHGGQGAFYLALVQPKRFRGIIAIPGCYGDDPKKLRALRRVPVWLIAGSTEIGWREQSEKTATDLRKAGVEVKLTILDDQPGAWLRMSPSALFDWFDARR